MSISLEDLHANTYGMEEQTKTSSPGTPRTLKPFSNVTPTPLSCTTLPLV